MINYALKYKVSDISRILRVEKKLVKDWAYHFSEYLNPYANPHKGVEREFTVEDICTLSYIYFYWEEDPDFENIEYGLNRGEQFEYPFSESATEAIPIFREYSDDLLTKNVWMIGGMTADADFLSLADSYKEAGDILVQVGIEDEFKKDLIYPAIFNYRHSTELYLKSVISNYRPNHNLQELYSKFQSDMKEKFDAVPPNWFENIIVAFDEFDPKGTSFRYGHQFCSDEFFIDLRHIKTMMDWFSKTIHKIRHHIYQ